MKRIFLTLLEVFAVCVLIKAQTVSGLPVCRRALCDSTFLYYTDFARYPRTLQQLPIAVFDSGTGGFTVLEKILSQDSFDNRTGAERPDGIPDFQNEEFQYLADQANMPYGRYAAEGKEDYLRELAVKDALFTMNGFYWTDESQREPAGTKLPAKIIVIACNTATAYGLEPIDQLLEQAGHPIRVIGVVNAGAGSTLEGIPASALRATVGVLATPGTISSGVYERTLLAQAKVTHPHLALQVVSQPGYGFAEAVDEEREFVDRKLLTFSDDYRGPVFGPGDEDIHPALLAAYGFDFSEGKAFIEYDADGKPLRIQLNSAANYARFNLLNLMEKVRQSAPASPLEAIILGCTHYPFLLDTLHQHLQELRAYTDRDGHRPYASLIADSCRFIDPAQRTAYECYHLLRERDILNPQTQEGRLQPFISRPSVCVPDSCKDAEGNLTYAFKYGRQAGTDELTTVVVPFSSRSIRRDHLDRLARLLPLCYRKIRQAMGE